jgi:hypothetical protein
MTAPKREEGITMVQEPQLVDKIQRMTNQELREVISHCEDLITDGSARIEDYEAFVLCQQELARRTWG